MMIRLVTFLSIMSVAFCQYPRHRAPPQQEQPPPQYIEEERDFRPPPQRIVHRPAPVHYVNIGAELAGDYKFGYDTGKGDEGQSFREETRLPDGTVQGAYGYVDASGRQRIVKYTAGKDGFKVEGDGASEAVSRTSQSRPAPQPAYREPEPAPAPAPAQPAYRPPPPQQPAYRPQPQPEYRAPPAPQQSYRPPPQPARAPPAEYAPAPQPAYRAPPSPPAPAPRSYAPRPQRPAPRREYAPRQEEPDYDYPDNEITERRLAPIDTSLLNYNIGTSHDRE